MTTTTMPAGTLTTDTAFGAMHAAAQERLRTLDWPADIIEDVSVRIAHFTPAACGFDEADRQRRRGGEPWTAGIYTRDDIAIMRARATTVADRVIAAFAGVDVYAPDVVDALAAAE